MHTQGEQPPAIDVQPRTDTHTQTRTQTHKHKHNHTQTHMQDRVADRLNFQNCTLAVCLSKRDNKHKKEK